MNSVKITDKTTEALTKLKSLTQIPKVKTMETVVLRELASVELITSRCKCSAKNKMPHGNHKHGCPNKVTL